MIEALEKYLPKGWREAARITGAFRRSRGIKSVDDLLMLLLLYLTDGKSYQITSTLMKVTGKISINKTATKNRIVKSKDWLKWLSENISLENGFTIPKPRFLGDKNVLLIDGSDVSVKGSKGSDYRLHYSFNLFGYCYESVEITAIKEGEKLSRYTFDKNDIIIADRAYGTIQGIEHAKSFESDYILRLRTKAFTLYDEKGNKIDIIPLIKGMREWETMTIRCFYKHNQGFHGIRLCIMKKDEKACEESRRKSTKTAKRKRNTSPSDEALQLSEYIIVVTSLEYTEEQIFELYRARWQIERVFLRLKSLFGLDEIPSHNEDSVLMWLYGKLFLASLCEAIVKQSHSLIDNPEDTVIVPELCEAVAKQSLFPPRKEEYPRKL